MTEPAQTTKIIQLKKPATKQTYIIRNQTSSGIKLHSELSQQLTFKNKFQEPSSSVLKELAKAQGLEISKSKQPKL
jgi:hypothetical protein